MTLLDDLNIVADEMLNNTGFIPRIVRINDAYYVASWTGIANRYTAKFENNTWHSLPEQLTYKKLVEQFGADNIEVVSPISFVGGS